MELTPAGHQTVALVFRLPTLAQRHVCVCSGFSTFIQISLSSWQGLKSHLHVGSGRVLGANRLLEVSSVTWRARHRPADLSHPDRKWSQRNRDYVRCCFFLFVLFPIGVAIADHLPLSHSIPNIIFCLLFIFSSCLAALSFASFVSISTQAPLLMSKPYQPLCPKLSPWPFPLMYSLILTLTPNHNLSIFSSASCLIVTVTVSKHTS